MIGVSCQSPFLELNRPWCLAAVFCGSTYVRQHFLGAKSHIRFVDSNFDTLSLPYKAIGVPTDISALSAMSQRDQAG